MHKQIIHSDRLQESYLQLTHESGLTILLYPMKGFSSTYAPVSYTHLDVYKRQI